MSDRTRNRINAAFDDDLASAPVPPSLRALSVRAAIASPRPRSRGPELLALVAALLVIAIVAIVFVATHTARNAPAPAGSTIPPAPIANAASAFDQEHGQMVIFGGNTSSNPATRDTWTWDGKYWRHVHPSVSPPARAGAVMAYDAARRNVVLFGGDSTWTWNGITWQLRHPVHQPPVQVNPGQFGVAMQYDPQTKTVLLLGAPSNKTLEALGPTAMFSWNGSDWKLLTPQTPSPLGAMTSGGRQVLMLAGGQVGGRYVTQTWRWDGTNWSLLDVKTNLPLLGTTSSAYDPGRDQLVLLTGDTWTWDGLKWTRQHPTLQPQLPGYMAYVPSLHEVVSWGDRTASVDNQMFGWDGSNWNLIEPGSVAWAVNNGKGRYNTRMTVDEAASMVRATVKNTHPVLLPTYLPSGGAWDALVQVSADDFNITYESDQRDKTITFGIVVANPPPGTGAHASDSRVKFRNAIGLKYSSDGYAEYFVYDTTDPLSQRWLIWNEPGSATSTMFATGSVPYFLSASGLTEQEFWQIANSLQ